MISVGEGLSHSVMHGVATPCGSGYANGEFGPDGLYACPHPFHADTEDRISETIHEFQRNRLLSVRWNVRFDHGMLSTQLQKAGFPAQIANTQVLDLRRKHEEIFANYRQTRRNEIRKCQRQRVDIRRAWSYDEVIAYCRVHEKLAHQKIGFIVTYPVNLVHELVKLRDDVVLLVADFEGQIVAGALFFIDGDSMFYWHGAADRDHARLFAAGALVDQGIQIACEKGLSSFNLGGSSTDSLRDFKESFGATIRQVWAFSVALRQPLPLRIKSLLARCHLGRR
jgi:lipid II:glycine glycyltransferase (peptidoglycan interpeptide bridge formation enzyme)